MSPLTLLRIGDTQQRAQMAANVLKMSVLMQTEGSEPVGMEEPPLHQGCSGTAAPYRAQPQSRGVKLSALSQELQLRSSKTLRNGTAGLHLSHYCSMVSGKIGFVETFFFLFLLNTKAGNSSKSENLLFPSQPGSACFTELFPSAISPSFSRNAADEGP